MKSVYEALQTNQLMLYYNTFNFFIKLTVLNAWDAYLLILLETFSTYTHKKREWPNLQSRDHKLLQVPY